MSCQKDIVKKISEKGADYVIGLKDNRPTLCQETRDYFVSALETPQFYPHVSQTKTQEKGHGRIETRKYYLCTDPDFLKLYPEWTNLRSVGMMKSTVIQNETTTEEPTAFAEKPLPNRRGCVILSFAAHGCAP